MDLQKQVILHFPSSSYISNVEKKYSEFFSESQLDPENLLLDLGSCKFIEVTSLLWILSLLQYRIRKSLATYINLPREKKVRDFLRVWRFPEAVYEVTGVPLFQLSSKKSHEYFGEIKNYRDLTYGGSIIQNGMNRLLSERFFSCLVFFTSKFVSHEKDVVSESDRFNTQLVNSVLSKQLSGPVSYVPSRIIFESIMNAIRHPLAQHFVVASFMDGLVGFCSKPNKHFTISIWDDGKSIIETLRHAQEEKKDIRAKCDIEYFKRDYFVIFKDSYDKTSESRIISSDFTPTLLDNDQTIFFSTFLPGITCDIEGKGSKTYAGNEIIPTYFSTPGMGLYILLNAVVDVFGGELSVRSDKYFMNIKKNKDKRVHAQYRVKVKSMPVNCPKFLGNMLTIRLPLNSED